MSAMRAEELPELPAALPQPSTPHNHAQNDHAPNGSTPNGSTPNGSTPNGSTPNDGAPSGSARTRAAARWTAPSDPPAVMPAPAPAPAPSSAASSLAPALCPAPRPREHAARRQATANPPLRLTRRGRIVIAVAAALVLAALSLVIASAAQATNHSLSPRAGQRGLAQVTVRPGQSLWSVAESADPGADTRVVIQQIIELNGLTGNVLYAGERLWVPRA